MADTSRQKRWRATSKELKNSLHLNAEGESQAKVAYERHGCMLQAFWFLAFVPSAALGLALAGLVNMGLLSVGINLEPLGPWIMLFVFPAFFAFPLLCMSALNRVMARPEYVIEELRRQIPLQLLEWLEPDLKSDQLIELAVDGNASYDPAYRQREGKLLGTHFQQQWMRLSTRVGDHRITLKIDRSGDYLPPNRPRNSSPPRFRCRYQDRVTFSLQMHPGQIPPTPPAGLACEGFRECRAVVRKDRLIVIASTPTMVKKRNGSGLVQPKTELRADQILKLMQLGFHLARPAHPMQ